MAAATISVEQEQFCCPVCLEILRDPVTIPCGHSYCLDCIQDYWDRSKQKGQCSCPQCRKVFNPRPLLSRNTVLGDVVERFQRTTLAKPAEVKSSGSKSKAVKFSPVSSESSGATHSGGQEEGLHGKSHKLTPASEEQEELCRQHDRVLRLYCRTDQQFVCAVCVRETHAGHEAVPVLDERTAQQKKLQEISLKSVQKLKDAEKELRYVIKSLKHSTDAAVEESERIFSKLIRSIEKQSCEVKEVIRVQERAAVSQAEQLLGKIQREMVELRKSDAELEKLCRTEDHIYFLQKSRSLHFSTEPVEIPNTDTLPYLMYKTITGALVDMKENLDNTCERQLNRISDKTISLKESSTHKTSEKAKVKEASIPHNSEPKTRADFLYYYSDLTLDPNTANPYLCLSDDQRVVTTRSELQPYPDHPDRFTSWAQVLCRAGMAGRCYWEVEWTGNGGVSVGVCYKNMSRTGSGSDCKLGHNSKSWSLDCSYSVCSFQHNKESLTINVACGSRIGVYLDYRGGTLSFYNISDTMVLLYSVKTTFSQPVYPGFWVGLGSTLKLCSL